MTDPFVGQLTSCAFTRAFESGAPQPDQGKKERIGRILQMHANNREEIKEVLAGDIAAVVGLKDVTTGETLCDVDSHVTLERMEFPEPVISQAVEPKSKADQERWAWRCRAWRKDPSFRVRSDEESGQTIISGMGELHLEIIVDRMKREFGVEANVGKPQVAYRETIRKTCDEVEGKFVKQSGGRGQYGHVVLKVEPLPRWRRVRGRHQGWRGAARVHPRGTRASRKPCRRASWPVTRSWTSRSRCSSARTTTWTRTKTRSRWPARWASSGGMRKASPCCSSP